MDPSPPEQTFTADLVWTGRRFEAGIGIAVGGNGKIRHIGRLKSKASQTLTGRALLPGFVNAHSHAFQRGLRGKGERFPRQSGSFWTWRQAMYDLVGELDRDSFFGLCFRTFREMLACGITTVGEFHYLHHLGDKDESEGDDLVLEAAAEAGIRIVLLQTFYGTGGIGQPLRGGQRRFSTPSLAGFWRQVDHLTYRLDPRTQSLGIVAHSVRAAELDDIVALHQEACRRGLVFHMHVEEQQQEIAACLDAYGRRPLALLNEHLEISEHFTAIHCTHSLPEDLEPFLALGGNICICPLTEANLGDGIAAVPTMLPHRRQICLGTDSNARLAMTEEMRWLEYVQRLALEKRGICLDEAGSVGRRLLEVATANGGRSLGQPVGGLEPGSWADFLAIDLTAPSLAGCNADTLLDGFILGARDSAISNVVVGGKLVSIDR